jgi:hypothetical protein
VREAEIEGWRAIRLYSTVLGGIFWEDIKYGMVECRRGQGLMARNQELSQLSGSVKEVRKMQVQITVLWMNGGKASSR